MPCIDTVQGFSFCPAAREPLTSIYRDLSAVHAIYTARTPKPFTWLYRSVSVNSTHSRAHNTAATQAACTPPASRWRAYRQAQHLHRYQIPPPRRTLYRPTQLPYYNKVYKDAAVRPCYGSMPDGAAYHRPCKPGGVSMLLTPGGLRSGTVSTVRAHRVSPAPSTRRGSPVAGARQAARNH